MDIFNCTPQTWMENESSFLKQLEDDSVWNSIPLLNANEVCHFKDSTLVRFQGMIQDMHSPEYYMEKVEVINDENGSKSFRNGKYSDIVITGDHETLNIENELNVIAERQTYVVTSVPGINEWVQIMVENRFKINQNTSSNTNNGIKRTLDEAMDTEDPGPSSSGTEVKKKVCNDNKDTLEQPGNPQPILSKEHILNLPLPCQNGKTCHLKLYKNQENLKLNDMCEFIGFLGINPLIEAAYQEKDEYENKMEQETLHPPSSVVPRIHCVSFKKLEHSNPLLLNDNDRLQNNKFESIHKELLIVFTQILLGDQLAAEYVILSLLSEVYMRKDFLSLGKFCLNISNIPKLENLDYVIELYKFITILVPKSYYFPMTLENMNTVSFIPKKDYECNRLTSGILQLSKNTHVVLDETKLSNGQLNSSGIDGVRALMEVIKHQKLTYDFKFYQMEFDSDIAFIICSDGKSMLGSDIHVVLKPERICIDTFAEILDAAKYFLKPELLNDARKYLTQARLIKYEISDKVEDFIQEQLVKMRQNGNVSADDLHNLLVLARLVSLSKGKSHMDEECWKKACEMEKQRKARIVK